MSSSTPCKCCQRMQFVVFAGMQGSSYLHPFLTGRMDVPNGLICSSVQRLFLLASLSFSGPILALFLHKLGSSLHPFLVQPVIPGLQPSLAALTLIAASADTGYVSTRVSGFEDTNVSSTLIFLHPGPSLAVLFVVLPVASLSSTMIMVLSRAAWSPSSV